ncbi:hypothetical protein [Helicobacter turcicus]|uniref:Uncharacterized protein n=1 Tax=Helicobacter turcicus TaxID=2867412 RepID=A0ABS7JKT7_9HELI|nr:hypothetical protein [Helicobacter turcicus]MBX7489996.1 hypothetical protein [Helicobacter turcicus]MBX7544855.1 hypothetical protein [Helicobacter turcicus]
MKITLLILMYKNLRDGFVKILRDKEMELKGNFLTKISDVKLLESMGLFAIDTNRAEQTSTSKSSKLEWE